MPIPAIIAGAAALGSLAVSAYNSYQQNKANSRNNDLATANYALNKETLDWNKQMAERDFNYNRQLQQTIFQREDSAVQRMVQDNRLAGLSPIAGLAGASAGQALEANTPQLNQNLQAPQMSASQLLTDFSSLSQLSDVLQNEKFHKDSLEIEQQRLDLEKSSNEANLQKMREEIQATQVETAFKKATMESRIEGVKLQNTKAMADVGKISADTIRSQLGADLDRIAYAKSKQELQEYLDYIGARAELGDLSLEAARIKVATAALAKEQMEGKYTADMMVLEEQLTRMDYENQYLKDSREFLAGIKDSVKDTSLGSLIYGILINSYLKK